MSEFSISDLILPGDPEYDLTLATTLPPDWKANADLWSGDYGFVVDVETGMLRTVNAQQMQEYAFGGEYDERLQQIDEIDDCFYD
jgi:hypothetical protein